MTSGIARIVVAPNGTGAPGEHTGMGIVLDARHVLTCAHVVSSSLGLVDTSAKPSRKVPVTFPMIAGRETIDGTVTLWLPVNPEGRGDIAILELDRDVPAGVGFARFAISDALRINEDVRIFGFKQGEATGNNVGAQYAGLVDAGLAQIEGDSFARVFLAQGYSGGAVRDANDAVVGMASAQYTGGRLAAYMIPVWVLRVLVPGLETVAPKSSSLVTIKNEVKGNQKDAITLFSHHCAALVKAAFPTSPFNISSHAKGVGGIPNERYFYIADVSETLNLLASHGVDDYPISYEIFFQSNALAGGARFDVALIVDVDYDMEIFGTFQSVERMQSYQAELARKLPGILRTDFVRIGAENRLEIGFGRQLTRLPGSPTIRDAPIVAGHGSESAAKDVINLKRLCEPVVTDIVMSYRRP